MDLQRLHAPVGGLVVEVELREVVAGSVQVEGVEPLRAHAVQQPLGRDLGLGVELVEGHEQQRHGDEAAENGHGQRPRQAPQQPVERHRHHDRHRHVEHVAVATVSAVLTGSVLSLPYRCIRMGWITIPRMMIFWQNRKISSQRTTGQSRRSPRHSHHSSAATSA